MIKKESLQLFQHKLQVVLLFDYIVTYDCELYTVWSSVAKVYTTRVTSSLRV